MTYAEPTPPLGPREVANALRTTLLAIRVECTGLPPALLRWHPTPGEWCILEVIGHLIEAEERGFAGRVRTLRAETDPAAPPAMPREHGWEGACPVCNGPA